MASSPLAAAPITRYRASLQSCDETWCTHTAWSSTSKIRALIYGPPNSDTDRALRRCGKRVKNAQTSSAVPRAALTLCSDPSMLCSEQIVDEAAQRRTHNRDAACLDPDPACRTAVS